MKKVWQEINRYNQTLLQRMCSMRMITFIIMLFFFMDLFLAAYRENVRMLGEQANIFVLPFLQTSKSFMKFAFLGVVYFYSNVPFMEKAELFYLGKLGKIRWSLRNIYYIVMSAFIISGIFWIVSFLEVFTVSRVSPVWGSVLKTLSLTQGQSLFFQIPYGVMKEYSPMELFGIIFILNWLVIMFLGLLMYVISLYGHKFLAGIIAIVIAFMPSVDILLGNMLVYYSPVSWLACNNWRIGYDPEKPGLSYIVVALLFLNFLLIVYGQKKAGQMEWRDEDV